MLVVIEGPDRTGKTTLAEALVETTGARYVHAGRPTLHPIDEYEHELASYLPGRDDLVLDRWHLGEAVWPEVFGRDTELDDAVFLHVDLLLRSRGGLVVLACRDLARLASATDIADEPVTSAQLPRITELFSAARDRTGTWAHYDFESRYYTDVEQRRRLERLARDLQHRAECPCAVTTEWIGSPYPKALLVGDRFNDGPGARSDSPRVPFTPYRSTSGHFLMSELVEADLRDVAICNAYRGDGALEQVEELWEELHRPPVVLMGKIAQEVVPQRLLDVSGYVPHPQYSRRFERGYGVGAYGHRIRCAIEASRARGAERFV